MEIITYYNPNKQCVAISVDHVLSDTDGINYSHHDSSEYPTQKTSVYVSITKNGLCGIYDTAKDAKVLAPPNSTILKVGSGGYRRLFMPKFLDILMAIEAKNWSQARRLQRGYSSSELMELYREIPVEAKERLNTNAIVIWDGKAKLVKYYDTGTLTKTMVKGFTPSESWQKYAPILNFPDNISLEEAIDLANSLPYEKNKVTARFNPGSQIYVG
jgi:hypothetical protein